MKLEREAEGYLAANYETLLFGVPGDVATTLDDRTFILS